MLACSLFGWAAVPLCWKDCCQDRSVTPILAIRVALPKHLAPSRPTGRTWWLSRPLCPMTFMETCLGSTFSILATALMRVSFLLSTLEPRLSNWICRLQENGKDSRIGRAQTITVNSRKVGRQHACINQWVPRIAEEMGLLLLWPGHRQRGKDVS